MDTYKAVALAEGFEDGTLEEVAEAWQYLHDTGIGYTLQGYFGRQLEQLINLGVIQ
jgi:hypothetical protein